MTPGFEPKNAQQAFGHLIEECGEVIAACGKINRYGWESYNPLVPKHERETNKQRLQRELYDLRMAIDNLQDYLD